MKFNGCPRDKIPPWTSITFLYHVFYKFRFSTDLWPFQIKCIQPLKLLFKCRKTAKKAVFLRKVVRVTGFEPAASCSQSRRATNCATPRYSIWLFFSQRRFIALLCPPSCKMSPMPRLKARPALCFAALPQAPCICHRQRSPSSPKAGALPTALHPDFLFCFFVKFSVLPCFVRRHTASTSRSRHLCYFNISGRVCQAGDWAGNCGVPSALMHTQRKTPPLWLTPGRWYSLGAKISPGTAGWTGSGHRYPAARLRWSCLRSPGA